jgi:hypothetical protein
LTANGGGASLGGTLGGTAVTAAMLDRLQRRSVVFNLDGHRYRLRDYNVKCDVLRATVPGTGRSLP